MEIKIPSVKGKSLINLKIGRAELSTPKLQKLIKSAYRTQAKKHHPDIGGNTAAFRKIHRAYEELISWAESPTFVERRGFPDKWFYDGNKNKWVQPTPQANTK
ncbi:MAG: DnaJ domain-containing protein [Deltaproteobacteria bacterium]|nr:DnaJ domain-containing protein [Deltaproteobacteria bacterium]